MNIRRPRNQTSLPVRTETPAVNAVAAPGEDRLPYVYGVLAGLMAGLFSAYIFKRASNEEPAGRRPASTGQIFSVVMSVVTLTRQIAEMGKPPQKK